MSSLLRSEPPLPVLIALWYATAAISSISTKQTLRRFAFPITVAVYQQLVSLLAVSLAAACGLDGRRGYHAAGSAHAHAHPRSWTNLMPVAGCMVTSLVSHRWSLLHISVAFTTTIKTLAPVFTIVFA